MIKTSKRMKWAVGLMLLNVIMLIPSALFLGFVPGFRAIAFSAISIQLLWWAIILIPYKRGEKWAWYICLFLCLWVWMGNIVEEIPTVVRSDIPLVRLGAFWVAFLSLIPIGATVISLVLSYKESFEKSVSSTLV